MSNRKAGHVINVKHDSEYDVYIGHQHPWPPYKLRRSIWANPFNKDFRQGNITREESIELYREYVLSKQELRDKLPELRGKVLACWCAPEPCHGDVLLRLAERTREEG